MKNIKINLKKYYECRDYGDEQHIIRDRHDLKDYNFSFGLFDKFTKFIIIVSMLRI